MDIHKPKPWHGLREFMKEYGIIVLGVLTALFFEQTVEAFHWRHEVDDERQALHNEVQANINAVYYRTLEQGCIDRRLNEVAEVFRRQAHGEPLGLRGPVLRPHLWLESTGSWQIAVADQTLSHMPLSEKLTFSDAFDALDAFKTLREQEDEAWRKLSLLDEGDKLTAADWTTLHSDYAEAKGLNERMQQVVQYPLALASWRTKAAMPNVHPEGEAAEAKFCQPMI